MCFIFITSGNLLVVMAKYCGGKFVNDNLGKETLFMLGSIMSPK